MSNQNDTQEIPNVDTPEREHYGMRGWEREMADLERMRQDSVVTIPEENFVRVFLPFFNGDEELNIYNVTMRHWHGVAGGPFNEVNVADRNGNIIYTVPPVFDNTAISVKETSVRDGLTEMINVVGLMAHQSPIKSSNFLRNYLTELHERMVDKTFVLEHILAWNKIFLRYDLDPIVIPGIPELENVNKNTDTNQIEQIDDLGDDFEIDPL